MNKAIIELERHKEHYLGYGRLVSVSEDSNFILDKLIEWSKENPEYKIYRHNIEYKEENVSGSKLIKSNFVGNIIVSLCDYVCYLVIYYQ